jgi:hypothetical protein
MRPSDWLWENIEPTTLYLEQALERLRVCEIGYADGMLTSHMMVGFPYPTFGRLAEVHFMTPREAVSLQAWLKPQVSESRMVAGYEIAAAIWRLVHPILEEGPPSLWVDDLEAKYKRDLGAIRSYGY